MARERAVARVNLAAIERNVGRLLGTVGPDVALCAVVKADGYGHGAVPAARAALAGGATWLAVATADEAAHLRAHGVEAPLLVLGALSPEELDVALAARADVVAWREPFVAALAARGGGRARPRSWAPAGAGRRCSSSARWPPRCSMSRWPRAPTSSAGASPSSRRWPRAGAGACT